MIVDSHYLQYLAPGYDKNEVLQDLMMTFGDDVWNFAFFLSRRTDAADDISQEAFLAVYDQLYSFRGECTIRSWLLTITRNKSYKYLNQSFIRKVTLIDHVWRNESTPSAEAEMFDQMNTKYIWMAVMKLPLKFREIIILNYHYELSSRELGQLLQISEGTVKSRLHRARKKITILLQANNGGDSIDEGTKT
jgi:RNA polymerase sigma-70 factor (ECF subfamily)